MVDNMSKEDKLLPCPFGKGHDVKMSDGLRLVENVGKWFWGDIEMEQSAIIAWMDKPAPAAEND